MENKSVDLGLAYRINLGNWGRIRTRLDGTYLMNLNINPGGGVSQYDCSGHFGPDCSPVTPKVRFRVPVDWDTPVRGLGFGATVRYYSSATNTFNTPGSPDYQSGFPNLDPRVPSVAALAAPR